MSQANNVDIIDLNERAMFFEASSKSQSSEPVQPLRCSMHYRFRLVGRCPPLTRYLTRPRVERASFLLCAAYLIRDRDVKLRVYPGVAPMMMMPIIMLLPRGGANVPGGFMVAFAGAYLGMIPLLAVGILKYSQTWQAADVFRVAPMAGPSPLYEGLRKAVLVILTLPMLVTVDVTMIALPVFY